MARRSYSDTTFFDYIEDLLPTCKVVEEQDRAYYACLLPVAAFPGEEQEIEPNNDDVSAMVDIIEHVPDTIVYDKSQNSGGESDEDEPGTPDLVTGFELIDTESVVESGKRKKGRRSSSIRRSLGRKLSFRKKKSKN